MARRRRWVSTSTTCRFPPAPRWTGAYLQFEASSITTGPASFVIQGVVGDHVEDFDRNNRNFADRPMTNASADWTDVEPWEAVGEKHWSANFGTVAGEIVAGAGWESGDAMVFTITGTGTRSAFSYDGKKSGAPLLYIEYTTGDGDTVMSASAGPHEHHERRGQQLGVGQQQPGQHRDAQRYAGRRRAVLQRPAESAGPMSNPASSPPSPARRCSCRW